MASVCRLGVKKINSCLSFSACYFKAGWIKLFNNSNNIPTSFLCLFYHLAPLKNDISTIIIVSSSLPTHNK